MKALHINGNDLTLEAVREVGLDRQTVLLAADAREGVRRARAVVNKLVENNTLSYAITTGVGKLSDVRIAGDQIRELQVTWCAHTQLESASHFLFPTPGP